jgi:hypothetical protein
MPELRNRSDKARSLQETVVEVMKEVLGNRHPDPLPAIHIWPLHIPEKEHFGESVQLQETVVEGRRAVLGIDNGNPGEDTRPME